MSDIRVVAYAGLLVNQKEQPNPRQECVLIFNCDYKESCVIEVDREIVLKAHEDGPAMLRFFFAPVGDDYVAELSVDHPMAIGHVARVEMRKERNS